MEFEGLSVEGWVFFCVFSFPFIIYACKIRKQHVWVENDELALVFSPLNFNVELITIILEGLQIASIGFFSTMHEWNSRIGLEKIFPIFLLTSNLPHSSEPQASSDTNIYFWLAFSFIMLTVGCLRMQRNHESNDGAFMTVDYDYVYLLRLKYVKINRSILDIFYILLYKTLVVPICINLFTTLSCGRNGISADPNGFFYCYSSNRIVTLLAMFIFYFIYIYQALWCNYINSFNGYRRYKDIIFVWELMRKVILVALVNLYGYRCHVNGSEHNSHHALNSKEFCDKTYDSQVLKYTYIALVCMGNFAQLIFQPHAHTGMRQCDRIVVVLHFFIIGGLCYPSDQSTAIGSFIVITGLVVSGLALICVYLKYSDVVNSCSPKIDTPVYPSSDQMVMAFYTHAASSAVCFTPNNFAEKYVLSDMLKMTSNYALRIAVSKDSGTEVSVKIFTRRLLSSEQYADIQSEVSILRSLDHKNIERCLDYFEDSEYCYLVSELLEGGPVLNRIATCTFAYSELHVKMIIKSILDVLLYMHTRNVVHCDLKLDNIIIKDELKGLWDICVVDFQNSGYDFGDCALTCTKACSNISAPEMTRDESFGAPVDMWGLGIIACVLLSGELPFAPSGTAENVSVELGNGQFDINYNSSIWASVSVSARDLVSKLLCVNPKRRFSSEQALSHDWFLTDDVRLQFRVLDVPSRLLHLLPDQSSEKMHTCVHASAHAHTRLPRSRPSISPFGRTTLSPQVRALGTVATSIFSRSEEL